MEKNRIIFKIDTFSLVECSDGFWLYDDIIGMNLSMRAKDEQSACIEALLYYQKHLSDTKRELTELKHKVNAFVNQFVDNTEDEND